MLRRVLNDVSCKSREFQRPVSTISLASGVLILSSVLLLQVVTSRAAAAPPQNSSSVSPGEFLIDPPTLINLGFEWFIEGDANHNATVEVSYRKKSESQWKTALPLLRLQNEEIYQGDRLDLIAPNMFAGSILDLEPGTEYEARFAMSDPDGVRGESQKTVTVRTRPEPQPSSEGHVYHVYPHGYKRTKIQPAFEGLLCAYYLTCAGTDWATASRPRVKPGDTILVHAGLYNRLKPGAAAIDRGVALPNVTDGFAGKAPDMGAIEFR